MFKQNEFTKKFKTRKTLLPYLEKILSNRRIDYVIVEEQQIIYVLTNVSGMCFHRCVEDAMCIEQQKNKRIPVLPYRIIVDDELRMETLRKLGCQCYTVLRKDLPKVERLMAAI